ncbi:MAG: hypothetical protein CMF62_02050 [Magnetococcales bacterium]|nr:hypothetical protein [Magnetococcales bacterium]|tara:strand:+ start:146192 stop:147892 length:1701 start_codon:yes stop_codon:yes gene_type:complete
MTDKKIVCRLDDYISKKINSTNICDTISEIELLQPSSGSGDLINQPRIFDSIENCEKECKEPLLNAEKFIKNRTVNFKFNKYINLDKFKVDIKVPPIILENLEMYYNDETRNILSKLKEVNNNYISFFISAINIYFPDIFYFEYEDLSDQSSIQFIDDNTLTSYSKKLLQDITKDTYITNFNKDKLLLANLGIQGTDSELGHTGLVLIGRQNNKFVFSVYDSQSIDSLNQLKNYLDKNFKSEFVIRSLNNNLHIQNLEKTYFKNLPEMFDYNVREDILLMKDEHNLLKLYNNLQLIDYYEKDKIDSSLLEIYKFFNFKDLFQKFKGITKEIFLIKMNNLIDNFEKYKSEVIDYINQIIQEKISKNPNYEEIINRFDSSCSLFSLRVALLLAFNLKNKEIDISKLVNIDLSEDYINELFYGNQVDFDFIFRLFDSYETRKYNTKLNEPTKKIIQEFVDKKLDNVRYLDNITTKLFNNMLIAIITFFDPFIQMSSDEEFTYLIFNTIYPYLNKNIQKITKNYNFYDYDLYFPQMFNYLRENTITYEEEQNSLSKLIQTKKITTYKLFK